MKKRTLLLVILMLIITVLSIACSKSGTIICGNCSATSPNRSQYCSGCGMAFFQNNTSTSTEFSGESTADTPGTNTSTEDSQPTVGDSSESTETTAQFSSSTIEHTHKYSAATCTTPKTCSCGATSGKAASHNYSTKVTAPTCTAKGYTTYTCACGNSYTADYVEPSHNYVNNTCSRCGQNTEAYSSYQNELNVLTKKYDDDVSVLEGKIVECNNNIATAQKELNDATIELASLSPTCPPGYIQDFVSKNWKEYGSTSVATEIAKETWKREYNFKSKKLNEKIAAKNADIQINQANIELYKSQISNLTATYNNNVQSLKSKYGVS